MNTIISLIRTAILFSLLSAAVYMILSTPLDNSGTWYTDLIIAKASGIACIIVFRKLYKRWKSDKIISKILD